MLNLTEREYQVLQLRRRPGDPVVTLREIARQWGCSAMRVKQVEDNALRKLGMEALPTFFAGKGRRRTLGGATG